jgi:CheY-like chemotaxis protein
MHRILVVEDEAPMRRLLELELGEAGYEVVSVSSGEEALELLERESVDLVVLDLYLEGMDGLAVLREALAQRPWLPVVIHSAYSAPRHDFRTWSAEAYVVKSGDLGPLKTAVDNALERRRVA